MGGISTYAVDCANLPGDAEEEITKFIKQGMQDETSIFWYYGWWSWGMYVYNLNMQSYYNTVEALALCAGKEDWVGEGGDFAKAKASMTEVMWQWLDWAWHPALVAGIPLAFLVIAWIPWAGQVGFGWINWVFQVLYLCVNILVLFILDPTWVKVAENNNLLLLGEAPAEEGGDAAEDAG